MRGNSLSNGLGLALEWLGLACLLPMRGQLNCRSSCSIFHGTLCAAIVLRLYGLLWDWLDCMSRENNFFACDSCEWSNTNYNECLCPLPWCPVSHFMFLSAVRDDLNWWEVVSVHPFGVVLWLYNRTSCMILLLLLRLERVWLSCRGWLSFECLFNVFRLSSTIRPTLNQDSSCFPEAVTLLVLYSTARCVLRL